MRLKGENIQRHKGDEVFSFFAFQVILLRPIKEMAGQTQLKINTQNYFYFIMLRWFSGIWL